MVGLLGLVVAGLEVDVEVEVKVEVHESLVCALEGLHRYRTHCNKCYTGNGNFYASYGYVIVKLSNCQIMKTTSDNIIKKLDHHSWKLENGRRGKSVGV